MKTLLRHLPVQHEQGPMALGALAIGQTCKLFLQNCDGPAAVIVSNQNDEPESYTPSSSHLSMPWQELQGSIGMDLQAAAQDNLPVCRGCARRSSAVARGRGLPGAPGTVSACVSLPQRACR